jgi:hypothetical protein
LQISDIAENINKHLLARAGPVVFEWPDNKMSDVIAQFVIRIAQPTAKVTGTAICVRRLPVPVMQCHCAEKNGLGEKPTCAGDEAKFVELIIFKLMQYERRYD